MKRILAALAALAITLMASPAQATTIAGTFTTAGTTNCAPGPALPCTMSSTDSTYAVLRFVLTTPMLFSDITGLEYDYTALLGGIGAGAPRAVFVTNTSQSFIVHFGPPGSFADPTLGPASTGNLLSLLDIGRWDLGGIGGSGYTDRTAALLLAGGMTIDRISLILDSFGGNDREFLITGINVQGDNTASAVPEPATLALLGIGLAGTAVALRRRHQAQ